MLVLVSLVRRAYQFQQLAVFPILPMKCRTYYLNSGVCYKRNPDVVAEALIRAKGVCECCKEFAPFTRKKDNSPYLEVHHIVPLAVGGEDTLNNVIALCPNCHREKHFGLKMVE
ncbi:HNH endonuclease [Enterovibrio nigricans]|uniref:HNH endonuclease n=1 Tax=Enterovibrio nigricans TaxID=504469 RepID=UPI00099A9188|nr:HNH endonuclease signature motif containing protein [Enterovibrio nigricans]PKF49348.1 HNH endonuclease [Enterovibrio nigricans]